MKKKLLSAVLAASMGMSLAACGGSETAAPESVSQAADAAKDAAVSAAAEAAGVTKDAAAEAGQAAVDAAVEAGQAAMEAGKTPTEAGETALGAAVDAAKEALTTTADGDVAYIKGKGNLVVGITDFAPMDYQEGGQWIGFDADLAREVATSLGVEAQFVEIDWDNKILELNNKSIDCVWNGMTLTDEVKNAMECTNAYCNNAQVVVVPADKADQYKDVESMKDLTFAVEAGSAGEAAAKENGFKYTAVTAQSDTLMEVKAGTSDAAIIDLLMAGAMIGEGTSYPDLKHTLELTSEEYGVGCRKGSDLAAYINDQFKALSANGTLETVAKKYGVQDSLVAQ